MFQSEGWLGPMKVVRQGDSDTFTYVSGHTRTCSLYCYLRMASDLQLELPKWMRSMAQSAPVMVVKELLSVVDRQVQGLVTCVEATVLARSFSYITLVRLMDGLGMDVGRLKDSQSCALLKKRFSLHNKIVLTCSDSSSPNSVATLKGSYGNS